MAHRFGHVGHGMLGAWVACVFPIWVQAQWQSLQGGSNWQARCFALSADSSKLLVGGNFAYVAGGALRANGLAWWDGEAWSVEGLADGSGDTSATGQMVPVLSVATLSDTVFVGMLASQWQYEESMGFAAMLAAGTWQPCGSPENWFFFLKVNDRLFNGGRADTLYGQYMPLVNEWINGAWQPLPNSPFDNTGTIYDATYWQGDYYFVGSFLAGDARSAIRFDGVDQWSSLAGGIGGNFTSAIAGYGDSLYAGGFLLPGPNVQSRHIQIWDGTQWLPFFDEVNVTGKVTDIQEYEGELYIAGGFAFGADTSQYCLLRYDGHQLCAIGGYMFNGGQPFAFYQGDLYMVKGYADAPFGEHIAYLDLATVVPDTCVLVTQNSVRELGATRTLSVFPNPANETLTVTLPNSWLGSTSIVLTNALGQVVARTNTASNPQAELSLGQLANGLYRVLAINGLERASGNVTVIR